MIEGLPAGYAEQHPQDWTTALDLAMGELGSKIDRTQVVALGVSGQQHGFVPLDVNGEVIRPAKLWCDTSTVAECAWLTKKLGGPSAVIRRTGLPFLPGYTAPKILWLKRKGAAQLPEASPCPPAARLPQLSPDRGILDGVRRCVGNRTLGCADP